MSQALSTAKVQSVREIRKKAKIKKFNKSITRIVVWFTVILILLVIVKTCVIEDKFNLKHFFNSDDEFVSVEDGIKFQSINFPIRDALTILEKDKNFNISFNSNINDQNYLTEIYNNINILQSVFSAKGKTNTLTINVVDNENNLIRCTSNLGDIHQSVDLNSQECKNLIISDKMLLFVDYPNSNLESTIVYINVEKKLIQIKPKNKIELDRSIQLILRGMYPDFEEIVDLLNNFQFNRSFKDSNTEIVNDFSNSDLNISDSNSSMFDINSVTGYIQDIN